MSTIAKATLQLILHGKPGATLLLLWPTLSALWIAAGGSPGARLLGIFLGLTFLMYCATCVVDALSSQDAPSQQRSFSSNELMVLLCTFCLAGFLLVLLTNTLTIMLSLAALLIASVYPLARRHTNLAILVSGTAAALGIPMAFAAQRNELPPALWLLFLAKLLWAVAYNTQYGMANRQRDLKNGNKSTAILLGDADRLVVGTLQAMCLLALFMAGMRFELGAIYNSALAFVAALFIYQQYIIEGRQASACLRAFKNNNWVGMVVFAGIVLHYYFDNSQ